MNDDIVGARTYAITSCLPMQMKRINTNKPKLLADERIKNRNNEKTV